MKTDKNMWVNDSPKHGRSQIWYLNLGDGLRISIVFGHIDFPGKWIMCCHKIGLEDVILTSFADEDIETVKVEALDYVEGYLESMLDQVKEFNE